MWTTDEKKAVLTTFGKYLKSGDVPKKDECLMFLEANKQIMQAGRSWSDVKDYVRNVGVKMCKSNWSYDLAKHYEDIIHFK